VDLPKPASCANLSARQCPSVVQLCCNCTVHSCLQSVAKHNFSPLSHDLIWTIVYFANLIIHSHSCWSAGVHAQPQVFSCTSEKGTVIHAHPCKCHTSRKPASIQHYLPQCMCRHSLQDECRILLLHGLLHLLGHDHELGDSEAESMAQQEQDIMQKLSWKARICYAAVVFPCLWSVACRLSCEVVSWNHS